MRSIRDMIPGTDNDPDMPYLALTEHDGKDDRVYEIIHARFDNAEQRDRFLELGQTNVPLTESDEYDFEKDEWR